MAYTIFANGCCGGKLFGYENPEKLKSLDYLFSIGKYSKEEQDGYYLTQEFHDVTLSAEQFKIFLDLYTADKKNSGIYWDDYQRYWLPSLKELAQTDGEKKLEWF